VLLLVELKAQPPDWQLRYSWRRQASGNRRRSRGFTLAEEAQVAWCKPTINRRYIANKEKGTEGIVSQKVFQFAWKERDTPINNWNKV